MDEPLDDFDDFDDLDLPQRRGWTRFLPFLLPFVVIVAAGIGAKWFLGTAQERGEPVELAWADLDVSDRFVRVKGLAHYPVVVKQRVPGNLLVEEQTFYLFPLFAESDPEGRAVRVLVRTQRKPERLVSYEVMTLEGRISPVTADKVPFETEIVLGKQSDYFFDDDMVLLEPWRIESDEAVWELPE